MLKEYKIQQTSIVKFGDVDGDGKPDFLGECYESLANIQLPPRNHALQAAYERT